jgi:N6-L-threonylcarbamoyladenine synthase
MLVLGIESTCDETAAAIVADGRRVLTNIVASQAELHARYRGVVPEIASRAHIENIVPVIQEALARAGLTFAHLDGIAVAHRPGLIGSLLIGVTAAKTLSWALGKPLIGVDHVQAHLYSVLLTPAGPATEAEQPDSAPATPDPENAAVLPDSADPPDPAESLARATPPHTHPAVDPPMPALGAVFSGGHTALYEMRSFTDIKLLGTTLDDAVGEAFDKVAAILGLGYPGGPIIDRLAAEGDGAAVIFPRSMLGRQSLDFSFSGLKTAVLYHVRGFQGRQRPATVLTDTQIADIAASFQAACIDVILAKIRRGARKISARSVIVGGGVSANRGLRRALSSLHLPVFLPAFQYCTDNAAMSAGLGSALLAAGVRSDLHLDAVTSSALAE